MSKLETDDRRSATPGARQVATCFGRATTSLGLYRVAQSVHLPSITGYLDRFVVSDAKAAQ
jgi:hypothetical protein